MSTRRTERMLAIAAEIVALEARLAAKKNEFHLLATGKTMNVGPRGRPTMRTRILELFTGDEELSAIEVKRLLPEFRHGSLDVQLGRAVEDGLLERVRWGVYRRARGADVHSTRDTSATRTYVEAHHDADVSLSARAEPAATGGGSVPAGSADEPEHAAGPRSLSIALADDDPAAEEPEPR